MKSHTVFRTRETEMCIGKEWCAFCSQTVSSVSNAEMKYNVYMEVCQKFLPVFRFFFMEKFPDPAQWFQRRLAYTRSVATNSIGTA